MSSGKPQGTQQVKAYRWTLQVAAALGLLLSAGAQTAPGQRDPTFGNNGRVGLLFPADAYTRTGGIVIQPNGNIVVAAGCREAIVVICVARVTPSGGLDPDFGVQGVVTTTDDISDGDVIRIVLQHDGKLVIAATCGNRLCAIRLNSNGSRDTSFGTNGKTVVTARTVSSRPSAFIVQRDGKLIFTGSCEPSANEPNRSIACVARLTTSGLMDASFGVGGLVFVEGLFLADAISEQTDGKLVLSGGCLLVAAPPLPQAQAPCAVRLDGQGALDATYGINGLASARLNTDDRYIATTAVIQPNDSVVIGGRCYALNRKPCVVRFDRSGMVDATLQSDAAPAQFDTLNALHLQPDGKLLVAGGCRPGGLGTSRVCFLRYHSDGSLDTSMPVVLENAVPDAEGRSIAVQTDGKIVVASEYYVGAAQKTSLYRFEGGPFGNTQCSLDIDGDGIFNPAIDGLLLTRATLGFTGPAVYAGISFPGNALRKQWGNGGDDDIRKFLVAQCGMRLNF